MNAKVKPAGFHWAFWSVLGCLAVLVLFDLARPQKIKARLEFEFSSLPDDYIFDSPDLEPAKARLRELALKINSDQPMNVWNGPACEVEVPAPGERLFKVKVTGLGFERVDKFCDELSKALVAEGGGGKYRTAKRRVLECKETRREYQNTPTSLVRRNMEHVPEIKEWVIDEWYALRGKTRPLPPGYYY